MYIVYNIRVQTPDKGGPITKTKYNVTKKNPHGPIQASSGTTRPDQSPIMSEMEKEEIFRGSIGSQDIIGKVNHSKRKKTIFSCHYLRETELLPLREGVPHSY